jgi:ammonia channel protein AmtB
MFGTLIIWILFPILAFDINVSQIDNINGLYNTFSLYTGPISIMLALGAGAIASFCLSSFMNGKIIARDVINGPIAGAIACGAASYYITNPVYAILVGFVAGLIQTFIQNVFEKKWNRKGNVFNTISFALFGFQGLIGSGFAAGWNAIVRINFKTIGVASVSDNLVYNAGTIGQNP